MHKTVLGLCLFTLCLAALLATAPAGAQSGDVGDAYATLDAANAAATASALDAGNVIMSTQAEANEAAARAAAEAANARAAATARAVIVQATRTAAIATVEHAALVATLDAAATTTALDVQATQAALDWQNAQVQALQTRTAADAQATEGARQAEARATDLAYTEARQAEATRQAVVLAAMDAETTEATKRQEFITLAVYLLGTLGVATLGALLVKYAWLTIRSKPVTTQPARAAQAGDVVDVIPRAAGRMPPIRVTRTDAAGGAVLQAAWDLGIKPDAGESEVQ